MEFVEKYDVIEHLKEERETMAYKVRITDSYIERHKHTESESHINKMEVERDYYADARDELMKAIDVLEVVVE